MLLYNNRSFWRVVLAIQGSVVFRWQSIVAGLIIAAVSAGMQVLVLEKSEWAPQLPHHFGMHAIGVIVAFAVVFRTNLGWQRYWEAMTQLHFMYSKWADAYTQLIAFAQVTIDQTKAKGGEGSAAKIDRVSQGLCNIQKYYSMLSALAADRLAHGDTQQMERRTPIVGWDEQIILRRELRQGPDLTGARKLPKFQDRNISSVQSLAYGWEAEYIVTSLPTAQEREALENSSDCLSKVMYWILREMSRLSKDIDIAPPIQSRMYQECSNGMLGLSNCLKIADVPFPFPYAQLLTLLLTVYACFIPVYITCFTDSLIASPILAFLLFEGIWGVNEVAKELENPFGPDLNDISLADFHARFLDVIWDMTPDDDDIAPHHAAAKLDHQKAKDAELKGSEQKVTSSAPAPVVPPPVVPPLSSPGPDALCGPSSVVVDFLPDHAAGQSGGTARRQKSLLKSGSSVPWSKSLASAVLPCCGGMLYDDGFEARLEKEVPAAAPPLPAAAGGKAVVTSDPPAPAAAAAAAAAPAGPAAATAASTADGGGAKVLQEPLLPAAGTSKVIDDNLALINARMEQHLLHMSKNLELLSTMAATWQKE